MILENVVVHIYGQKCESLVHCCVRGRKYPTAPTGCPLCAADLAASTDRSWPMAVLDPNLPLERNFQFCRKKNFNVCCERHTIRATAGESEDEKKRASLLDILRTSRSSGVRKQSGSRPPSLAPVRKLWLNLHWLACHSAMLTPEPPISFGRSFIFGNPSFIRSLVSS